MKVLVLKCSDYSYEEELEAKDWNEIMKELLSRYPSWVIEPIYEHLKRRHPDIEYQCLMYDGYLE